MTPDIQNFDRYFEGPELQASNQLKHLGPYFDVAWSDSKTINAAPIEIPWLQSGHGLPVGFGIRQKEPQILIGVFEDRSCIGSGVRAIGKAVMDRYEQKLTIWTDEVTRPYSRSQIKAAIKDDLYFKHLLNSGVFAIEVGLGTYAQIRRTALKNAEMVNEFPSNKRVDKPFDYDIADRIGTNALLQQAHSGQGIGSFMLAASIAVAQKLDEKTLEAIQCCNDSQTMIERSGFLIDRRYHSTVKPDEEEIDYTIVVPPTHT